jgi:hypothetical protein
MNGWFGSTGGGGIAMFCIAALGSIAVVWFIAEVVAPIVCGVTAGCGSAKW